jgi:hypothetical protein
MLASWVLPRVKIEIRDYVGRGHYYSDVGVVSFITSSVVNLVTLFTIFHTLN